MESERSGKAFSALINVTSSLTVRLLATRKGLVRPYRLVITNVSNKATALVQIGPCGHMWNCIMDKSCKKETFWRWFNWGMQSVLGRTLVCVNNRISPSLRTADVSPRSSPLNDAERRETSAVRRLDFTIG